MAKAPRCGMCNKARVADKDALLCRRCAGAEAGRIIARYPHLRIPRGRGRYEWDALKHIGKNPKFGRFETGKGDRGNAYYAKIEFN